MIQPFFGEGWMLGKYSTLVCLLYSASTYFAKYRDNSFFNELQSWRQIQSVFPILFNKIMSLSVFLCSLPCKWFYSAT